MTDLIGEEVKNGRTVHAEAELPADCKLDLNRCDSLRPAGSIELGTRSCDPVPAVMSWWSVGAWPWIVGDDLCGEEGLDECGVGGDVAGLGTVPSG
jgi:hypothetical protein